MSFISRLERFDRVDSTQRIVREWLNAAVPAVCVAVADEQTAGRGRLERTWHAPTGAALLLSAGFRPDGVPLREGWRWAATASLAMLDAAEEVAGLRDGTISLKWPNDLVAEDDQGILRKVAGVLGETQAADGNVTTVVIGIGVDADWPATEFPADLASSMTSLRELGHGRPVDRDQLLDAWLARLEPRMEALDGGHFDAGSWSSRQITTGRHVDLDLGHRHEEGRATGVDPDSGALLLEVDGRGSAIASGEVIRCRIIRPLEVPGLDRSV